MNPSLPSLSAPLGAPSTPAATGPAAGPAAPRAPYPTATTSPGVGGYRLVRTPVVPAAPPLLDARQRAVVEHRAGPLLVLGGPGTGRTTALVEAVTARARAGTPPERILVLTFHREAALDLRDRIAARLGSDTPGSTAPVAPQALTFHSYCYGLLRAHQPADRYAEPVRLLSGPEQDLMVRELLAGQIELVRDGRARVRWPDELRAALTTRGFADEVRAVLARSRELGLAPEALRDFARRIGRPDWRAAADLLAEYLDVTDLQGVIDYTELVHRAVRLARRPDVHAELARRYDAVYVDEYQDTDPAQVRLLRALAGGGRTLVAFGDPDQAIYAFRGADVNAILDFPERFPRRDGGAAPIVVLTGSHRATAPLLAATRQLSGRLPLPRLPAAVARAHRFPTPIAEGRPAASMTAAAGPAASVKAAFAAEGGSAGGRAVARPVVPRGARSGERSPSVRTRRRAPRSTPSPTSCAAPTWRRTSRGPTWPSSSEAAPRSPPSAAPSCRQASPSTSPPPTRPCTRSPRWRRCCSPSGWRRNRRGRTGRPGGGAPRGRPVRRRVCRVAGRATRRVPRRGKAARPTARPSRPFAYASRTPSPFSRHRWAAWTRRT